MTPVKPLKILLLEESPSDAYLTNEAIEACAIDCQVHVVQGSPHALGYVRERRGNGQPDHDIVLFGLNPFRVEARDILTEYRMLCRAAFVPLIVLRSSPVETDILRSFAIEADGVLLKPVCPDAFHSCITKALQVANACC